MIRSSAEVWASVKADMEASYAPFGEAVIAALPQQTQNLLRVAASRAYVLAMEDAKDIVARANHV